MTKQLLPISVVIADDHPVVLHGLEQVLRSNNIDVLASCDNGYAALAAIRQFEPTVAVLEVSMPELSGLDLLREINVNGLPVPVVFLTATASEAQLAAAIAGGAKGIVLKGSALADLVHCIRIVAAGGQWYPSSSNQISDCENGPRSVRLRFRQWLTSREREVALMVAEGIPNKEVARRLSLCEGTVKIHLHKIYEKLGVHNRTALAAIAITHRDELSSESAVPLSQHL